MGLVNPRWILASLRASARILLFSALLGAPPSAFCQTGSINGTVADGTGASIAHASLKLSIGSGGAGQEIESNDAGEFSFSNVAAGRFDLSVSAKGFAPQTIAGELHEGETLTLPRIVLAVDTLTTEVTVTKTQAELAEIQIKEEEQQRLVGLLPNFFVAYDADAAPLDAKQKLELTWKSWLDPSSFVIEGVIAGVWQARNSYRGFGQGGQGYAKRYGAGFADYGTSLMLDKFVLPTLFKQDPRYFYKGAGTKRSRFFYAISQSVVCRGDNKQFQFCYSSFIDRFGTEFLTNRYYPKNDRNSNGVLLENGALSIVGDAVGNLFQEFISKKITRKKP